METKEVETILVTTTSTSPRARESWISPCERSCACLCACPEDVFQDALTAFITAHDDQAEHLNGGLRLLQVCFQHRGYAAYRPPSYTALAWESDRRNLASSAPFITWDGQLPIRENFRRATRHTQ